METLRAPVPAKGPSDSETFWYSRPRGLATAERWSVPAFLLAKAATGWFFDSPAQVARPFSIEP
jgi:hypothetical protein